MYQLAIAEGILQEGDSPGGGRLVYLGKPGTAGPTERQQDPLTPQARGQWREVIGKAAATTQGPQFTARINDGCAHCPVRPSCPAQAAADGTVTS
jgi:RecB family exonuclease